MDRLEPVLADDRISCYRLLGDYTGKIRTYVATTPFSRELLNRPEVYGCRFTNALRRAVTLVLKHFPEPEAVSGLEPEKISVVHFLRSGLNFGIRDGLYDACRFNTHLSSFLTSQRQRDRYGRWYVREDQYRKLEIPDGVSFFIGEIVATGVTVENGFDIIFRQAKNLGRRVENVFFFTIGCHKIEKTLRKYDGLFRSAFTGYRHTYLIYLEGKFHLADSKTRVAVKIQGTDLMRAPALLAPEFELSQFGSPAPALERCVIYDGGARAFNVPVYLEDVRSYWERMEELARGGMTLAQALAERWPASEYELPFSEFRKVKSRIWGKTDPDILRRAHRAYRELRTEDFRRRAETPRALLDLCRRRLRALRLR